MSWKQSEKGTGCLNRRLLIRVATKRQRAIPGTEEKLNILAERARAGLPLWHERDRADYEEPDI